MHNKISKISILFLGLFVLVTALMIAFAEEQVDSKKYDYVISDDANLLSESEQRKLLEDMIPITEYGNVVFHTTLNNNIDSEEYSRRYLNSKFGKYSIGKIVPKTRIILLYTQ